MADITALKNRIRAAIKANDNQEITGPVLQQALLDIVDELNGATETEAGARQNGDSTLSGMINAEKTRAEEVETQLNNLITGIKNNIDNGYVYAGIATPSSTPVSGKVFYLALTAGTYTNFGGQVLTQGINILRYNGSTWSNQQVIGIDDKPIVGSDNLVKSGGIYDALQNNPRFTLFKKENIAKSATVACAEQIITGIYLENADGTPVEYTKEIGGVTYYLGILSIRPGNPNNNIKRAVSIGYAPMDGSNTFNRFVILGNTDTISYVGVEHMIAHNIQGFKTVEIWVDWDKYNETIASYNHQYDLYDNINNGSITTYRYKRDYEYQELFHISIDDKPIAGSNNLVKSGGVYANINALEKLNFNFLDSTTYPNISQNGNNVTINSHVYLFIGKPLIYINMPSKTIDLGTPIYGTRNMVLLEIDMYETISDATIADSHCRYIVTTDLSVLNENKYYLPLFYYDNSYNIYYLNKVNTDLQDFYKKAHKIGTMGIFNSSISVPTSDIKVSEKYVDDDGFARVDVTIPDVFPGASILDIYSGNYNYADAPDTIAGTYKVPYAYGMLALCSDTSSYKYKVEAFSLSDDNSDELYVKNKYPLFDGYGVTPVILIYRGSIVYNAFLNINQRYESDIQRIDDCSQNAQEAKEKLNLFAISGNINAEKVTETVTAPSGATKNTRWFPKSSLVQNDGYLIKIDVKIDVVEPTLQIYRLRNNIMEQVGEIDTSNAIARENNTFVLAEPIEVKIGDYYLINATAGYVQDGHSWLVTEGGDVLNNAAEFQQSFHYSFERTYQEKTFYVLDAKGKGDFLTIEDVLTNVPINSTVFVKNGEYSQLKRNGNIVIFNKGINWIGENRDGVVFSHYTGNYGSTAIVYSGVFKNIKFLSGDNGIITPTDPNSLAYALHIDFMEKEEGVKFGCAFYNCNFTSYWNTCVGCGQRKDYVIEMHDCEFQYMGGTERENASDIYKRCCIAVHNVANTDNPDLIGKGYIKLYNCRLQSNGSCCMMIHNHVTIDQPNIWELIGNVMYSDVRGKNCVYSSHTRSYITEFDYYGTELSKMSFGNNVDFLNADQNVIIDS